jgi:transcriptional regulator with XRE-family HTH domain
MDTIQELLEALRKKGWTIAAISDALGYNRETISRWRKGSNPPSQKVVELALRDLLRRKRIPKQKRYTQRRMPETPTA